MQEYLSDPDRMRKFKQQKASARRRGISFLLSFEQWWGIWEASGKWEQRGKSKGNYCMARYGDKGPYAVKNVFICTVKDGHLKRRPIMPPKLEYSQTVLALILRLRGEVPLLDASGK
jgi:hypothetical protein